MPAEIKSIFLAASEKAPAERAAYLAEACGLDSGLRRRVEALLRAHDESGGWLGEPEAPTSDYPGFTAPSIAELAPRFPQLEILELLGQGGMGAVYKARQKNLDRLVALKILPHEAGDAAFAERFTREARTLARLNHPGIVAVHDFGSSDGLYWFVMEYVDGVNLRQAKKAGSLSPAAALAIIPQICEALQFAHDAGVVHRDVKPENVLLDSKGRVKIADFGLAKLLGRTERNHLTGTHQAMGTPHYMAPEQWERPLEVDHRADIYSLGVVFYELLTGELPLGRFAPPSQRVQVDVRLDEVVLKTLEKEPGRRYQRASDVKLDVERISSAPTLTSPSRSEEKAARPTYLRLAVFWPLMIILCGGVLPLLIFVSFGAKNWDRSIRDNIAAVVAIACWIAAGIFAVQTCRWFLDRRRGGLARRLAAFGSVTSDAMAAARRHLGVPSCGLLLVGLATLMLGLGVTAWATTTLVRIGHSPTEPETQKSGATTVTTRPHSWLPYRPLIVVVLIAHALAAGLGAVIAYAAVCMRRLEHLPFAQMGSLLAMLPVSVVWPVGLCVGIGSLLALRRPEVEAAFDRDGSPAADTPARPAARFVLVLGACLIGFFATFVPWSQLRIFGIAVTSFGFDGWNGLVAGSLFLASGLLLIALELLGADRLWKTVTTLTVGLAVAAVNAEFFWAMTRGPQITSSSGDELLRPLAESFFVGNINAELSVGPFVSSISAVVLLASSVVGLVRRAPREAGIVEAAVIVPESGGQFRSTIATWLAVFVCLAGVVNAFLPWLRKETERGWQVVRGFHENDPLCGVFVGAGFLVLGILLYATDGSVRLRPWRALACLAFGSLAFGMTALFLAQTYGEVERLDAHYENYLRGVEPFLPRLRIEVGPIMAAGLAAALLVIGAIDLRGWLARRRENSI